MAVVAGVLLNHVNQKLPQRDGIARAVLTNKVEVGLTSEPLRGHPGHAMRPMPRSRKPSLRRVVHRFDRDAGS